MTEVELFQKLRPVIQLVTGLPNGKVVMADQNEKAPPGEYCTIRPSQTIAERGQANIYAKNAPGDLVQTDVRAQIVSSCSMNFYRGNALVYARKLHQCNKRPDVSVMLFKSGKMLRYSDRIFVRPIPSRIMSRSISTLSPSTVTFT